MNRYLMLIFLVFIVACSKSDSNDRNDGAGNCNFIANNAIVNAEINLNLPQYSQLQFTSNSVYIANQGVLGVYLSNVGNSSFRAFDAADPAHFEQSCSRLTYESGMATCGCTDANQYSLLTGQALNNGVTCLLKEYRVERSGSVLFISN